MMKALAIALFAITCACHSDSGTPAGDDVVDVDAAVTAPGWTPLISRTWSIPAGATDTYRCKRIQIMQDTWITGFKSLGPLGTHHTVVTISDAAPQLGDYDCQVGSLDLKMLYAAGVNTDDMLFPTGVAMKIKAGQYVNLNLHLFNVSDQTLADTSGVLIKTVTAAEVVHEADMTFAGNSNFSVPSDNTPHDVIGGCNAPADWHLFGLWPHMHQHATHQKVRLTTGTPMTLLDDAYSFSEQRNYPMTELAVAAGTHIEVTCTFVNNTGTPLKFGDSSNEEMCFTGMYKWPAGGNLFQCSTF